jgi:hypothetical protein
LQHRILAVVGTAAAFVLASAGAALAQSGGDTLVNVGSPPSPFSQNKQNEPAVAIDANHPNVVAAGSNDEIDMEACNAGPDDDCPFTPDVGVSGIYFSSTSGDSWTQPTYTGLTGRNCLGAPGDSDPPCTATTGPIGTLPHYAENGLVSDGDPALAFGPAFKNGKPSWANGSRLYYANLTALTTGSAAFKGAEAIAVSHTDNVTAAAAGNASAWSNPVIASKQGNTQFSDKEQVWADNAQSSPYFGNAYVCYAAFRSNGPAGNQPLMALVSRDGGNTWRQHQLTAAANNVHGRNGFGRSGCTVRTDSQGNVYVFDYQFAFNPNGAAPGKIQMIKSTDGGSTWSRPRNLFTAYDACARFEPSIGRCVEDGVAGARDDLAPAPSVDIANGAPTGGDATDRLVMTWIDGRTLNHEKVQFSTSTDGGATWSTPVDIRQPGDRGYYTAPAISPNGTDVWVVYNAWVTPFRNTAVGPFATAGRGLEGVVEHAPAGSTAFTEVHRGAIGDARGSSQNDLAAEFLGDYVYAAATRTYGTAVWNDVRNAADCPAIDRYRQKLHDIAVETGQQTAEAEEPRGESSGDDDAADEVAQPPDVQEQCPANFGNSDIYGGSYPNP